MRYWCGVVKIDPAALSSGDSLDWSGRGMDDARARLLADAAPCGAASTDEATEICVSIAFNRLTSVGAAAILSATKPHQIRELDVSGCKLAVDSESQEAQITRVLQSATYCRADRTRGPVSLTLSCCNLDGITGASALGKALRDAYPSAGLEHLDVSRNALGNEGVTTLLYGLGASRTTLRTLCLASTGLTSDGMWPLCMAVRGIARPALEPVAEGGTVTCSASAGRALPAATSSAAQAEKLVSAEALVPEEVIAGILSNTDAWTLRVPVHRESTRSASTADAFHSVDCPAVGAVAAEPVDPAIAPLKRLESLELEGACLCRHGVAVLIGGLFGFASSPPLMRLDLSSCRLDSDALSLTAKAVGDGRLGRLRCLALTCNRFDERAMSAVSAALGRPAVALQQLLIESPQKSCTELDRLLQAMEACAGLVRWKVGRACRSGSGGINPSFVDTQAANNFTVKMRDLLARFALASRA